MSNENQSTLERRVQAKRKLISKHQQELKDLLDTCTHEGTVVEKSRYFEGSYYDKAHTTYWNECTLCGKKSEDTIKEHGWYG